MVNHDPEPTSIDVAQQIEFLLDGRISREEIAAWADQWVLNWHRDFQDETVHEVLESLSAADTPDPERQYLFGDSDFRDWLQKLQR